MAKNKTGRLARLKAWLTPAPRPVWTEADQAALVEAIIAAPMGSTLSIPPGCRWRNVALALNTAGLRGVTVGLPTVEELRQPGALRCVGSPSPTDDLSTLAGAGQRSTTTEDGGRTMSDLEVTLAERGSRYGDFTDHAVIAQGIQDVMRRTPGWDRLTADKKQALTVIADKQARILSGDPEYRDNWHDIQGYARLAEDRCAADTAA